MLKQFVEKAQAKLIVFDNGADTLSRLGDVADRIICKDGVWGVEKNVGTIYLNKFN